MKIRVPGGLHHEYRLVKGPLKDDIIFADHSLSPRVPLPAFFHYRASWVLSYACSTESHDVRC
jgi:hypothetical protein